MVPKLNYIFKEKKIIGELTNGINVNVQFEIFSCILAFFTNIYLSFGMFSFMLIIH
jgi:hypothetical protein